MVGSGRLERPTYGFEARRSIQLSYEPLRSGRLDSSVIPAMSRGAFAKMLRCGLLLPFPCRQLAPLGVRQIG